MDVHHAGQHSFRTPYSWSLKLRISMSHFRDLFSAFSRYIAPAYHHDRCERSVQMRLYTMHKREVVLVFVVFFACFWLSVFIGVTGPAITTTATRMASELNPAVNKSQMATGPFLLQTPTLFTYNQQFWVTAKLIKENRDAETIGINFHVALTIQGVTDEGHGTAVSILDEDQTRNRSRRILCSERVHIKECSEFTVLHLGFLDYSHYIISIRFYELENIEQKYPIKDVTFYFRSYNAAFTRIEIWFRFIFLLATFAITCWFSHSLRKFLSCDWSIEQKWMSVLLPLLLLYNDPVFPLTFLINSWLPGLVDATFQATFLCALLLFWLCTYHGIRQNERHLLTFYFPKLAVVGLLWVASVTLAAWHKYNELLDPTYDYKPNTDNYDGFKVVFLVVGGVYVIYLLYLIVMAYGELRSMPYFDVRLKFLTFLMLAVLTTGVVIVMRFGIRVLEDNFVAELTTTYKNSSEFMASYGLLNFYLYTMAYVYSPSKNAVFESHFKDNPTFSMINDSDEEVVYGSDGEDRPLTCEKDREESD